TDAVENDRNPYDSKPIKDPLRKILISYCLQYVEAKPLYTDHRSDDDHAERHHDSLIDTRHYRRHGKWDLDLPQLLRARAAIGVGCLEHLLVHQSNTKIGKTDDRRNRIDDNSDEARHPANAK